jgi:hypothetical protein
MTGDLMPRRGATRDGNWISHHGRTLSLSTRTREGGASVENYNNFRPAPGRDQAPWVGGQQGSCSTSSFLDSPTLDEAQRVGLNGHLEAASDVQH